MLMTKCKSWEQIADQVKGNVFVLVCHGCREVSVAEAEHEVSAFIQSLAEKVQIVGEMTTDYICNPEYLKARFARHEEAIAKCDTILVFSCGVGVQTIAEAFPGKRVCAACDTYPLPGFQGVTPLQHDCGQCGECYLNLTGGICPITACSKSLLNGQCGGAKNGMCEVDPGMECGWERIQRKLTQIGRLDALKCPIQIRNYATDDQV